MTEPLDAIMAIHNAFRHDMERIDAAALEIARGKQGLMPEIERFRFLNEILGLACLRRGIGYLSRA